jgi:hypothetical protein
MWRQMTKMWRKPMKISVEIENGENVASNGAESGQPDIMAKINGKEMLSTNQYRNENEMK